MLAELVHPRLSIVTIFDIVCVKQNVRANLFSRHAMNRPHTGSECHFSPLPLPDLLLCFLHPVSSAAILSSPSPAECHTQRLAMPLVAHIPQVGHPRCTVTGINFYV